MWYHLVMAFSGKDLVKYFWTTWSVLEMNLDSLTATQHRPTTVTILRTLV